MTKSEEHHDECWQKLATHVTVSVVANAEKAIPEIDKKLNAEMELRPLLPGRENANLKATRLKFGQVSSTQILVYDIDCLQYPCLHQLHIR